MPRLNLTLDADTIACLDRHAKGQGAGRAGFARRILREALDSREALVRRKALAADYTAGRRDAREILDHLEAPQLEGFDDEE
jgi:hypothetical protein